VNREISASQRLPAVLATAAATEIEIIEHPAEMQKLTLRQRTLKVQCSPWSRANLVIPRDTVQLAFQARTAVTHASTASRISFSLPSKKWSPPSIIINFLGSGSDSTNFSSWAGEPY